MVGGGVVAAVAIAELAFRQGPQPYDSAKYFRTAVDFPDVPADIWTLRIGLVLPVRLAVLALGPSEAALYAVPFLVGLALAAATYGTTLLLAGDRVVAACAALVLALYGDVLLRSSAILPDPAATATFTASVFFLVLGARRPGRSGVASAAAAGALFGATYLIREFSPILLPAAVAVGFVLRYPLRRAAVVAGTAVSTAALELVYGAVQYGDPLVHLRMLVFRDRLADTTGPGVVPVRDQLDGLLDTLAVFPRLVLAWNSGWAILALGAVFLVALVVRFRDRRLWLLAGWAGSYWLAMALLGLGSFPSGRWLLNITSLRYWFPLLPALVMGGFVGIAVLLPRHSRLAAGVVAAPVAALAAAALSIGPGLTEFARCADRDAWPNDQFGRWHDLRNWLATPEAARFDVIATDLTTSRLVPAFTSTTWGDRLWGGSVTADPVARDRRQTLVLVHRARFGPDAEAEIAGLRSGRVPVFASRDGELVALAAVSETTGPGVAWPAREPRAAATRGSCGTRPYAPQSTG